MMGLFVAVCVGLSAVLLLLRRNMSEGKHGYHKKSHFYRSGLDIFAFGLGVRGFTAADNGVADIGSIVVSVCVLIFTMSLVYEAWRKENPPSWWPWVSSKPDPPE